MSLTEADILIHLRRRLPSLKDLGPPEPLFGGLMNQVWRVGTGTDSVVVKHASPHVAAAPEIAVDPSRLGFEARALVFLGEGIDLGGTVAPPRFLDYDEETHVLVMEDLGPGKDLGERLRAGAATAVDGAQLGEFLGHLHRQTTGDYELRDRFNNAPVQVTREAVQYRAVSKWLRDLGREKDDLGDRAAALGARLRGPGRCLIMGDLWPASLLRTPEAWRILDWEFCHFGQPAQDVAHLLAHLWMLQDRADSAVMKDAVAGYRDGFLLAYGAEARGQALWDEASQEDLWVHLQCEVLARTCGPFRAGYLYEEADDDLAHGALDRLRQEGVVRLG